MTRRRVIILIIVIIVAAMLGRLAVRAIINLMLGGTLAMLYAYRDVDKSNEAAARLFSVMLGSEIDINMIGTNELQKIMKPISGYAWVNENSVPSVIAYGKYDKICPFKTAGHLMNALKENGVDYQYFEATHSGHGLQNDNKVYEAFMDTVVSYLDKYMPVAH